MGALMSGAGLYLAGRGRTWSSRLSRQIPGWVCGAFGASVIVFALVMTFAYSLAVGS